MKRRGHLGRVLLSHDAGWYDPAKPDGGTFRPFDLLFTTFLPQLREQGFSESEIDQLTIGNPAEAYAEAAFLHATIPLILILLKTDFLTG